MGVKPGEWNGVENGWMEFKVGTNSIPLSIKRDTQLIFIVVSYMYRQKHALLVP